MNRQAILDQAKVSWSWRSFGKRFALLILKTTA